MVMRHLTRTLSATVVGAMLALVALPAVALADPPDESGLVVRSTATGGVWYEDPADGLVLLTGGPAQEACAGTAGLLLSEQFVETPTGAIVLLVEGADAEAWLYSADTFGEVCDTALAGGQPDLLAQGIVNFRINDNDLFASQTRTNSFGDRLHGTLVTPDGSIWRVTAQFHAVVLPSDDGSCHCVLIRSDINLIESNG
jgi:hypothetical protein